jgi:F-box protein, helicase, 18
MYQLLSSCSSGNTPFIRHFDSFTKYKEFVQSLQFAENATVAKLVEKYDAQCPQLMAQFLSRLSPIEKRNCVVLTTAHTSKWLEFDHMKLGDDFINLNENLSALTGPLDHSLVKELNILYVAVMSA